MLTFLNLSSIRPALSKSEKRIYIFTGAVNEGKTSLIAKWLDAWRREGVPVSGILSEGVFDGEAKIGYDLVDIAQGKRHPLIRRRPFSDSWHLGGYFFDRVGFSALAESVYPGSASELFILDEVGPLELQRKQGFYELLKKMVVHRRQSLLIVVRESEKERLLREIRALLKSS